MKATATSAIVLAAAPGGFIPALAGAQPPSLPFETELAKRVRRPPEAAPVRLTPRQVEVLSLLYEGLSNKVIGRRLNISCATVKIHVTNILRTLNVSSRLEAVVAARRLGWIGEPAIAGTVRAAHSLPLKHPVVLRIVWDGVSLQWLTAAADEPLAEAVA